MAARHDASMDKHGHAAKGSNALLAAVDFYSTALADCLGIIEEQRITIKTLAEQLRFQKAVQGQAESVLRAAVNWAASARGADGVVTNPAIEKELRKAIEAFRNAQMDDRSFIGKQTKGNGE